MSFIAFEFQMENTAIISLSEAAGYTIKSVSSSQVTVRHSTKMGGVTIRVHLTSLQATTTIDSLGKWSQLGGSWSWLKMKLKRSNMTMVGLETLLDNPFRGTFCEPLEDGWVEHGSMWHMVNMPLLTETESDTESSDED